MTTRLDDRRAAVRTFFTQGRRRWMLAAALVAAAAGVAYWQYGPSGPGLPGSGGGAPGGMRAPGGPGMNGRPTPVQAKAVRSGELRVFLTALGTVTPVNSVTVRSRVDGELLKFHFQEGQMVKAGALLAEIDPRAYQVQQTQAEGQLAKDQALLANARIDLARYQTLLEQDSIAKQQVDTQAALVRQYAGTVKSDEGQVANARLQLSYTRITAPVSGRVGLRQVTPGNIVHASDATGLVIINQIQPIQALFALPEDNLPAVQKALRSGSTVLVEAWDRAQKNKLATGRLLTLDNQIDTTTGTVKLKAEFANDGKDGTEELFPNQFVNIRLLAETRPDALLLPTAAVLRGSQGTFVFIVRDDGTVTPRPVKLGPVDGEVVAVESGLTAGDKVVVDGTDRLRDGAKVEVVEPTIPAAKKSGGPRKGEQRRGGPGGGRPPAP